MLGRFLRELGVRWRRTSGSSGDRPAAAGPPRLAADYASLVNGANQQAPGEARRLLQQATALEPDRYEAWHNLGVLEFGAWRLDESVAALRRALALLPHDPQAACSVTLSLGLALQRSGEWKQARELLEATASTHPAHADECLRVSLLGWVVDADSNAQASLDAHRRWATRFADPLQPRRRSPERANASSRALRIGYVSGDFRSHAVSLFFEPVLAHHDRSSFEVFCYDNSSAPDEVTRLLQRHPARWRTIRGMGDEQCARMIGEDRIDILVDLSGHTAHNRLSLFAIRPAPLQVTWLGYRTTTGMAAMDYRVTDAAVDPPGRAADYAEKLITLPGSQWCFHPLRQAPEPGPLPMLRNGHATFGSFNQFDKLNGRVLDAWTRLLLGLPRSRLVIAGMPQGDRRRRFLEGWQARGVDPSRIELHGYLARDAFHERLAQVDMALDSFPCNGGTTTCESLWMGVPVVTLAGDWHVARAGLSLMSAAGLPDWVARDEFDYVTLALSRAGNPEDLSRLRGELRERLASSALMDGERFTRSLERGFMDAWRTAPRAAA